jgi:hypothetical protein
MPSDDDRPPRLARRVDREDDEEFSDPPPEGPAPYLFRRPHSNEGRLLGYALPASAVVLVLAGIWGGASPPGFVPPKVMVWGFCVPVWAWGVSHFVRRSVFK